MANRFNIDEGAVEQLLRSPHGPVARELERRARRVEVAAKALVPVRTGRLRASITTGSAHLDGAGLRVLVGSRVHYAGYVEGGTSRAHPRPYLRPALGAVRL